MRLISMTVATCVAFFVGCDANTQRKIQGKPTTPAPVIVDRKTQTYIFADGDLQATVQNNGAPGYVTSMQHRAT